MRKSPLITDPGFSSTACTLVEPREIGYSIFLKEIEVKRVAIEVSDFLVINYFLPCFVGLAAGREGTSENTPVRVYGNSIFYITRASNAHHLESTNKNIMSLDDVY